MRESLSKKANDVNWLNNFLSIFNRNQFSKPIPSHSLLLWLINMSISITGPLFIAQNQLWLSLKKVWTALVLTVQSQWREFIEKVGHSHLRHENRTRKEETAAHYQHNRWGISCHTDRAGQLLLFRKCCWCLTLTLCVTLKAHPVVLQVTPVTPLLLTEHSTVFTVTHRCDCKQLYLPKSRMLNPS